MSRIRSLHPGIFTDDAYMNLSIASRELVKGLWCESDDNGVFEWKPATIKARIFPFDNLDIGELLAELVSGGFIRRHEVFAKSYGAVRNFLKYQRPRRPTALFPLPDDADKYLGGSPCRDTGDGDSAGEILTMSGIATDETKPLPTLSGKSPQMEDVVVEERRKELDGDNSESPSSRSLPRAPAAKAYGFEAKIIKVTPGDFAKWAAAYFTIPDLAAELLTIDAKLVDAGHEGKWFGKVSGWLQRKHEDNLRRGVGATADAESEWRDRLSMYRDRGSWHADTWGPKPGDPACMVPPRLLAELAMADP